MNKGVTFWTEGGSSIGFGHLMRCINVAHAVRKMDHPCHFLVNNDPAVAERLEAEGMNYLTYALDGENASRLSSDVVVIDTKKDVSRQVQQLRKEGKKVLLIDNHSSDEADCMIIPSAAFRGACLPGGRTGAEFIIIGDNFVQHRNTTAKIEYSKPLKVLVTMGAADPNNLTLKVIKALKDIDDIEITAVIGPAFRPSALYELISNEPKNVSFIKGVKDMAPLMRSSHIAFTAYGTTIYELSYMGVPSIIIANYHEDETDLREIELKGASIILGHHEALNDAQVRLAVAGFVKSAEKWESMSERAEKMTDGKGAFRIAEAIDSLLDHTKPCCTKR